MTHEELQVRAQKVFETLLDNKERFLGAKMEDAKLEDVAAYMSALSRYVGTLAVESSLLKAKSQAVEDVSLEELVFESANFLRYFAEDAARCAGDLSADIMEGAGKDNG